MNDESEKNNNPLPKLKVKAKSKSGRGEVNASAVVDAMRESWSDLQEAIGKLDTSAQDALRAHFNELIEGEEDLGDILFGTADEFDSRVKYLDD